jgi:hypothetical protein
MNQQANPYAAPKAKIEAVADEGLALWRDGKILVCRREAEFPGRCVKCNEPAEFEKERFKLNWHASGWYILVLLNVIIYAVIAAIVRKRATIWVGLCESHKRRRMLSRVIGWGGFAAIIAFFFLGISRDMGWMAAAAGLAFLPWAFASVLLSPQIRAARIDKEVLRVRGCGRDFLDTLPEYVD